jgi:hypothetical protein
MDKPERELDKILIDHSVFEGTPGWPETTRQSLLASLLAWRNKRDEEIEERLERLCEWRGITESTRQEVIGIVLKAIKEPEVCDKCGRELP